jgi:hypothetical protein
METSIEQSMQRLQVNLFYLTNNLAPANVGPGAYGGSKFKII